MSSVAGNRAAGKMRRHDLEAIFSAALQAVSPDEAVRRQERRIIEYSEKARTGRVVVVGFGKASCPMVLAVENILGDRITGGAVITKYGHCDHSSKRLRIFEGGHPIPDENGMRGAEEIVRILRDAGEDTLVICLISGGGSALLVSPCEGISLSEKQAVTGQLLKAGADIHELNTVRKHLSNVKGGRLAEIAYPARVLSLILSDVIGDNLDIIASGPTAPDESTYTNSLGVLEKYNLIRSAPEAVISLIRRGVDGAVADTPKSGNPVFKRVENIIVGSNRLAIEAARAKAESLGFAVEILTTALTGEATEAAGWLAAAAQKRISKDTKPLCLISGGETTVTVRGNGLGGRNTELALAFAQKIAKTDRISLLSAGTDGSDGPTDAAGAVVDGRTVPEASSRGLDAWDYLSRNDSYSFFKETGELLITGPTGTNVMDIQIIIIE